MVIGLQISYMYVCVSLSDSLCECVCVCLCQLHDTPMKYLVAALQLRSQTARIMLSVWPVHSACQPF